MSGLSNTTIIEHTSMFILQTSVTYTEMKHIKDIKCGGFNDSLYGAQYAILMFYTSKIWYINFVV